MTERHYDFGQRRARRKTVAKTAALSRAFVWRVVWQRVVGKTKRKNFGTKQAAERFFQLMVSDEPWELFRHAKAADDAWCHCENLTGKPRDPDCGVKHGGGCGLTVKEYIYARRRQLPALEWVRLERRPVGQWETTIEESQFMPEGRSLNDIDAEERSGVYPGPELSAYVERPAGLMPPNRERPAPPEPTSRYEFEDDDIPF